MPLVERADQTTKFGQAVTIDRAVSMPSATATVSAAVANGLSMACGFIAFVAIGLLTSQTIFDGEASGWAAPMVLASLALGILAGAVVFLVVGRVARVTLRLRLRNR